MEAYVNPGFALDFKQRIRKAHVLRITENRKANCSICLVTRN